MPRFALSRLSRRFKRDRAEREAKEREARACLPNAFVVAGEGGGMSRMRVLTDPRSADVMGVP